MLKRSIITSMHHTQQLLFFYMYPRLKSVCTYICVILWMWTHACLKSVYTCYKMWTASLYSSLISVSEWGLNVCHLFSLLWREHTNMHACMKAHTHTRAPLPSPLSHTHAYHAHKLALHHTHTHSNVDKHTHTHAHAHIWCFDSLFTFADMFCVKSEQKRYLSSNRSPKTK